MTNAASAHHPSAGDAWRETLGRRPPGAVAWISRARCRGLGPERFYPDSDDEAAEALELCAECSVRDACLRYVLDAKEDFGVWGGKTEGERRALRRRRARMRSA